MKSVKTTLICLLLCASLFVFPQQDVTIETIKLTDNIYMLKGYGGNIGVMTGEDGVFMIDSQFGHVSDKIKIAIGKITDKPISFLLNTHWHHDHTRGNANFKQDGAIIVAHDNVRQRLSTDQFDKYRGKATEASGEEMLPIITFSENISFQMNGESIMVFHVDNAHTDGDAMVYFTKSNVLHMGDVYFQGKYPFIDVASGGNANGYIEAIKQVLLLVDDNTKIIPGHRNLSNKKELEGYLIILEDIKAKIQTEIDAGKTEDEVTNNTSLTKTYDDLNYGDWFITPPQIRRAFYVSLKE